MVSSAQPALPFRTAPLYRPADFIPAPSNAAARQWLDTDFSWSNHRFALSGPPGCGKTHLARRWAAGAALWFDGPPADGIDAGRHPRIVIDRADTFADEPALLHWLNACAEGGRTLLLIGRSAPARWHAGLADLQSRLRATQAAAIDPPEESLLRTLLARLLAERQLSIAPPVRDWLLVRLPRTAAALHDAVARLDAASLARQQPVTRGLVRACLTDLLTDVDD